MLCGAPPPPKSSTTWVNHVVSFLMMMAMMTKQSMTGRLEWVTSSTGGYTDKSKSPFKEMPEPDKEDKPDLKTLHL